MKSIKAQIQASIGHNNLSNPHRNQPKRSRGFYLKMAQRKGISGSIVDLFDCIFYKIITTLARLCAVDIFNKNYRVHARTVALFSSNLIGSFLTIYTVVTRDLETALNTTTTWGIAIQGLVKYFTFILFNVQLRHLVESLRKIYVLNIDNGKRTIILQKWIERFLLLTKIFTAMIFIMVSTFALWPILWYQLTGLREMILPIFLPFVDDSTNLGYIILTLIHLLWLFQVAVGLSGADMLTVMLMLHILPLVETFECAFYELNEALLHYDHEKDRPKMDGWLQNLVNMHQDISRFLKELSYIYRFVFFCDVNTNALTLCFGIFCLMIQTWLPLYCLMLVSVVKLFLVCLMGSIVETATDRILMAIQSSRWYLLPVRLQRHIMLMIMQAQRPTIMMSGNVPLNLDTFVNVMKNVYSVAMLLVETVN